MKIALGIALLLAFAGSPARASTDSDAKPDASPRTVLIVGDSLSSAHGIPVESGWVALLERRLANAAQPAPVLVNSSRGGKTMTDALAELPALIEKHHPQVIVIELGGNDAFLGAKVPELRQKLTQLIDLAQASGAKVTVLGLELPPALDENGAAQALREAYATTAAEQDVSLLPSLLAGISDKPELLQADGVHPTAAAQTLVLENAWPTLKPLLQD